LLKNIPDFNTGDAGVYCHCNAVYFVLLSAKWLPSVPYFQLLCLASLFTPFYALNSSALNARGLSNLTFKLELI